MQTLKQLSRIATRISPHGKTPLQASGLRFKSSETDKKGDEEAIDIKSYYYPNTDVGIKERSVKPDGPAPDPLQTPYPPFPGGKNPKTGEAGGPTGPEPTRFGDWERKGRVTDF